MALKKRVFLGGALAWLTLGFSVSAQATNDRLLITGSSSVAPLAAEVAKRFEQQNKGVRIDVQSGGSSRGIADARNGLADIGMVSRALKSDETDLQAHTVALDGSPSSCTRATR